MINENQIENAPVEIQILDRQNAIACMLNRCKQRKTI